MTNSFLTAMQNTTTTENGDLSFKSSGSGLVDFFSKAPVLRTNNPHQQLSGPANKLFRAAVAEDPKAAVSMLFYLRDIRGGSGERESFRNIFSSLNPQAQIALMPLVPEYGRWDDVVELIDSPHQEVAMAAAKLMEDQLRLDIKAANEGRSFSLLAKWMPSLNAGKRSAAQARKMLSMTSVVPDHLKGKTASVERIYRKTLSFLREKLNILERHLSAGTLHEVDYQRVPSRAMKLYRKMFKAKDQSRFEAYLASVQKGEAKINASTLTPTELLFEMGGNVDDRTIEALWANLPDYCGEGFNGLVVADVSGSMGYLFNKHSPAMNTSVGMALYIAERNTCEVWRNVFMTFSSNPQLVEVKGKTLREKLQNIHTAEWGMNTDLQRVFDKILTTAKANNLKSEELPQTLIIISDMQFDGCVSCNDSTFQRAQKAFAAEGYDLPKIVFWNVSAKTLPAKVNDKGVALISGYTPATAGKVLSSKLNELTPLALALESVMCDRYEPVRQALGDVELYA